MKYFKQTIIGVLFLLFTATSFSQYKIIWDIALGDTAQQRIFYKQINNVLIGAPDTKIEVVYHGNAIFAMVKDTGYHKEQIMDLYKKGVVFAACRNSLRLKGIDTARVIPQAILVPVAILELVKKQEAGWSYIKAGSGG